MDGAADPSGTDASCWKCLSSDDLFCSLAALARKLCTTYVAPKGVSALVACHLIALDKNPGVCPIGNGEVCRRIICKAILAVIKPDIVDTAGYMQGTTRVVKQ